MDIAIVEAISKTSAAGLLYVELGFVPDFAMVITNHGGVAPDIRFWANRARFPGWTAAAQSILMLGSTGVLSQDTASVAVYDGGESISAAETTDSDPKHVNRAGLPSSAGRITAPGISIPAGDQTAGGRNLVVAMRSDV
jgi:hypothetical protein